MKKKRFLSLILMLVMLVSTLVMSGCGTEKKSGNEGNYGSGRNVCTIRS